MPGTRLFDLAKTIRSKNAGVDHITFDVIFPDSAVYDRVRRSGVLSRDAICRTFGIAPDSITDHVVNGSLNLTHLGVEPATWN